MNRPRLNRFRKMRRLAQNEYDRRILYATHLRRNLDQIATQIEQYEQQIERAADQLVGGLAPISLWQPVQASIERWRQQIRQLDEHRVAAQNELAQALEGVRQQKSKLDAWDKLIENEQRKQTAAKLARDMQVADEQYLMGTFARSQQ